jgi:hypothetical protein
MNNSWNHLAAARNNLAALEAIKKKADPASGVSFAVRRGVARDNEDVKGDHVMRPWVTIEASLFEPALDAIIAEAKRLIEFWEKATKRDIEEAAKVLDNDTTSTKSRAQ